MIQSLLAAMVFWPLAPQAATLADCDAKSYDVIVHDGGAARHVMLTPWSGVIREYGPDVAFEVAGTRSVPARNPEEDYCIWSGKVTIQRRHTWNDAGARGGAHGGVFR